MRRGAANRNAFESFAVDDPDAEYAAEDWQKAGKKRMVQGKHAHHQEDPSGEAPAAFDARREREKEKQRCKTLLCKYYPNCGRGDRCWFSHDPALADAQAAASNVLGAPAGPAVQSRAGAKGPNTADRPCPDHLFKHKMCTFHLQGHCGRGSACTYAHGPHELRHRPAHTRNGASGYSTPSSIESVEARENGLNGRELSGKMAALRMNADTIEEDEAPDSFCCPITHEILRDPVVACDGYSYERGPITNWLQTHNTSPMTNEPLESKYLVPNRALLAAIRVLYS
ncbi:hypothetical protein WJX75_008707 [Coccomyxa subellipsoidea]|uniref:RING-type E3 ubiquitin transferase n=1 Tax=Coccomyxa subellipsoidea TaxID=248742 RepID=A0ABR2YQZ0_9CHLO